MRSNAAVKQAPASMPVRVAFKKAPVDSVIRNFLAIFLDDQPHSVGQLWLAVDGRQNREYTYAEKLRRVSVYILRANRTILAPTLRHIIWHDTGYYQLAHKPLKRTR